MLILPETTKNNEYIKYLSEQILFIQWKKNVLQGGKYTKYQKNFDSTHPVL